MSTFKTDHLRSSWLPILTAIACTLTGGTLLAAPAVDEVLTVTVSYADLDLSKRAGAQTLYQRIKHAARWVCAPLATREVGRMRLWRDCYEQAVAEAVATVNRPTLTALHRATRLATG